MLIEKLQDYKIILGSGSPRRKQLLSEMGIQFDVRPAKVNEVYPENLTAAEIAGYLSKIKADAFNADDLKKNTLVITADTIVTLEGEVLGKPESRDDAIHILKRLSGKPHEVITGVTLKTGKKEKTFSVLTLVYFKELEEQEIVYYVDHFKPYDKAGAYGIQEWIGHVAIDKIEGSYFNVMGLPTHRLYMELVTFL